MAQRSSWFVGVDLCCRGPEEQRDAASGDAQDGMDALDRLILILTPPPPSPLHAQLTYGTQEALLAFERHGSLRKVSMDLLSISSRLFGGWNRV